MVWGLHGQFLGNEGRQRRLIGISGNFYFLDNRLRFQGVQNQLEIFGKGNQRQQLGEAGQCQGLWERSRLNNVHGFLLGAKATSYHRSTSTTGTRQGLNIGAVVSGRLCEEGKCTTNIVD